MLRITLTALLLATPALAQDKAAHCEISAGIAGAAVEERSAGADASDATATISATLPEEQAIYIPAVQPIVDWVYTLPQEQLTDEVATTFETSCLEQ